MKLQRVVVFVVGCSFEVEARHALRNDAQTQHGSGSWTADGKHYQEQTRASPGDHLQYRDTRTTKSPYNPSKRCGSTTRYLLPRPSLRQVSASSFFRFGRHLATTDRTTLADQRVIECTVRAGCAVHEAMLMAAREQESPSSPTA